MTVGKLIEGIAGTAAAIEGKTGNCSTFRVYKGDFISENNEDDPYLLNGGEPDGITAQEYFGRALERAGYERLGTHRMYSGIHGDLMDTEIFMGVINYQRLRHMVKDKAQVRREGPKDMVTGQPVGGRKKQGGVRFGEMERDSLLAHGASFLLHDRLMRCSDASYTFVCPQCGSCLSAKPRVNKGQVDAVCTACAGSVQCRRVELPSVFRYMVAEFASLNINLKLNLADNCVPTT